MATVEDQVAAIVADQLGIDRDEITSDSPFTTELGADSLDQAGMMVAFEKAFSVRFPPGSADRVRSIGEVIALIEAARTA